MTSFSTSKPKPTIAHFIASSIMGGVEIATLRLTALTAQDFHHIAFCLPKAVELKNLFESQGVETKTYTLPTPSIRHARRFYTESAALARQIEAADVDIIHFSDKFAAYYGSLAALLTGSKVACHIRLSHPTLTLRERLSLVPVRNYIFVSEEARRTFAISLPEHRTRVVYDAVEVNERNALEDSLSVRTEFQIPETCPLVGVVARVAPQKDFDTLASAAALVLAKHPGARFLVVGEHSSDQSLRAHFEQICEKLRKLNIADRVIFTNYRKDVLRLVNAFDISVLCTNREGFPLSILECMALRKPMVATAVGGIPEIIRHGETGYLHKHGDSKELAEIISFLIENPAEAERIGIAGYDLIKADYSQAKYVREMVQAYSDIVKGAAK